ncbi:RodZ family helix-turn-helix domain-containing protein [Ectopseudomonas mendocina]|uniref:RodZ family helix-turn-helix domain-containing protein n=1 Tax=Ectopseudomonas mendocina TaxID=300 RepID=A0ABZ2RKV1_ECTME
MKTAQPETVAVSRVNPGETLRNAREARGWAVAEVAAQLNLTTQRLNEIEQGAFEKVPGLTFARGYVRTYAKLLGLDQAELVRQFDAYTGSTAAESTVHSLDRIQEPRNISQRVLKVVSIVALVGLAGASFIWWQDQAERREQSIATTSLEHVEVEGADGTTQIHPLDEPEDQAVEEAQQEAEADQALTGAEANKPETEPGSSETTPAAQASTVGESAVGTAEASAAPALPSATEPTAAAAAVTPAETSVQTPAAPVQAGEGEAVIALTFTADCWIQIKDATGKILHASLKRKGERYEVAGKAPLELRLGYARGASVRLNGAEVDIAPFISGETARLKLGGQ